jgi:ABC-type multidrug transport system fused ATPase/permease subunit
VLALIRGHARAIAAAVALALAASGLRLVQPLVAKDVVDSAAISLHVATIILLAGLFVSEAAVGGVARYVLGRASEGIVLGVRLKLVDHLLRLHTATYDGHRIGDLLSLAAADSTVLRRFVADAFSRAVTAAIGLIGTAAFMIWLDWVLFSIVAGFVVVGSVLTASVLRGIGEASFRVQRAIGWMSSDLERALSAIRTVRMSRGEERESHRIGGHARSAYGASVHVAKLDALVAPASQLAINGSYLVILVIGSLRVSEGTSSLGDLVAFMLYMTYLTVPIGNAFQAMSSIQQGLGALQRIKALLAAPVEDFGRVEPRRGQPPVLRPCRVPSADAPPALELLDVWFGYDATRPVLRGASLRVPERGHVALIGPSGAGKSTILALAGRLYDPDRGQIRLCGVDMHELSLGTCRGTVGLVEQDAPVLYGTLRDNITYSAPNATDAEIDRAVGLASLGELVDRLPAGLDAEVGEHGDKLSGGERQRLAIARSLLARPSLLLLDEPTAHLDAANEAALSAAIAQVSRECALLVIAHRFSTIRTADRVVILRDGIVASSGTHEELLAGDSYYRSIASASAA